MLLLLFLTPLAPPHNQASCPDIRFLSKKIFQVMDNVARSVLATFPAILTAYPARGSFPVNPRSIRRLSLLLLKFTTIH